MLFEVFVRSQAGLSHRHVGSLHAPDAASALQNARDLFTRRREGMSLWVVPAESITATQPDEENEFFASAADKPFRYPEYFALPKEVKNL